MMSACKKEKLETIVEHKIKSIHVYDDFNNGYNYTFRYTYSENIDSIICYFKLDSPDTTGILGTIFIDKSNKYEYRVSTHQWNDYVYPEHRYKVYLNDQRMITSFTELDASVGWESPYIWFAYSNQLNTVYQPTYQISTGRFCYNYHFDGSNYTQYTYEYQWYSILDGTYHSVLDSARITYTNLPFNQYAPLQIMYMSSALPDLTSIGEAVFDPVYFLSTQGYFFYPPNKNLVATNNNVTMGYDFNSNNQLSRATIFFPNPTTRYMTYDYEYY